MRDYELTVLLRPDISEKELDKEVADLSTLVSKNGAKVNGKKDAVKKRLAYEIGKLSEAYYILFDLAVSPSDVAAIESKLKLADNVVRYLLVKKEQ